MGLYIRVRFACSLVRSLARLWPCPSIISRQSSESAVTRAAERQRGKSWKKIRRENAVSHEGFSRVRACVCAAARVHRNRAGQATLRPGRWLPTAFLDAADTPPTLKRIFIPTLSRRPWKRWFSHGFHCEWPTPFAHTLLRLFFSLSLSVSGFPRHSPSCLLLRRLVTTTESGYAEINVFNVLLVLIQESNGKIARVDWDEDSDEDAKHVVSRMIFLVSCVREERLKILVCCLFVNVRVIPLLSEGRCGLPRSDLLEQRT